MSKDINLDVKITTKHLLLVPVSLDYAEEIFREFTPEITTFIYPKPATKIEDSINFITTAIQERQAGTDLNVAILSNQTGEYLGGAGLHKIHTDTPELGIWIKKTAHGSGYGKEAIFALKEWADQNLTYKYLTYPVAKENIPSRHIPEALGGIIAKEYDKTNLSGNTHFMLEYHIYPPQEI